METIESKEHNFEVNDTNGILLALENGHEIELSEGDGFRMVSNGDIPHIELYMDDEPFSIKIEEKTLLSRILDKVIHVGDIKVREMTLKEAAADDDISSEMLAEAYAEAREGQPGLSNKTLVFEDRTDLSDLKTKIEKILDTQSGFSRKEVHEVTLKSVEDGDGWD